MILAPLSLFLYLTYAEAHQIQMERLERHLLTLLVREDQEVPEELRPGRYESFRWKIIRYRKSA